MEWRLAKLLDIGTALFPIALAGQGFLGPTLFAGFEIKGVTLNLFNDIFLLHFAFETT